MIHDNSTVVLRNFFAASEMLAAHVLNKIELASDDGLTNQTLVMVLWLVGGLHVLFAGFDRLEKTVAI